MALYDLVTCRSSYLRPTLFIIIQDFIPGDDSCLFDAVAYCSSDKKLRLLSFAQIGRQEHTKNMVGNEAVLISGYNQFGGTEEIGG